MLKSGTDVAFIWLRMARKKSLVETKNSTTRATTHHVSPVVNSTSGMISFPSSPTAFSIFRVARIDAMEIQALAIAK